MRVGVRQRACARGEIADMALHKRERGGDGRWLARCERMNVRAGVREAVDLGVKAVVGLLSRSFFSPFCSAHVQLTTRDRLALRWSCGAVLAAIQAKVPWRCW